MTQGWGEARVTKIFPTDDEFGRRSEPHIHFTDLVVVGRHLMRVPVLKIT